MAEVKFKRIESSSNINNIPIVDGQLIYTKDGKEYLDYETTRIDFGSSASVYKKLWENADPDLDFAGQTITLNSSDYDLIIWIFQTSTGSGKNISQISLKGYGSYFHSITVSRERTITYVSDTSYTISDCTTPGYTTAYNDRLIPICAIGIKTGLF